MKTIFKSLGFAVASLVLASTQITAQTNGAFDRKAAEQKAIQKNLPPQDVNGYIQALEAEHNAKGHNYSANHASNDPYGVFTIHGKPGSGGQSTQSAGCPNASFENNNFGNWTGSVGNAQTCGPVGSNSPLYTQTSVGISSAAGANVNQMNITNYHTIMNIPATNPNYPGCNQFGYDSIAVKAVGGQTVSEIPFVCPFYSDGTSVRMNGAQANYRACKMRYQFNLTPTNRNVSYAFAAVIYDGTHNGPEQPFFQVRITDQNGNPIGGNCGVYNINASLAATDTSFKQSVLGTAPWNNFYYRRWKQYGVDMSGPASATVTQVNLEFTVGGCCYGGHWAYAYVDAECSQGGVLNAMCAGTNSALVTAPGGYVAYQWYGPNAFTPVSNVNGGNTQTMTANPAIVGQTYTVNMVTPTGCTVQLTNTINISTVTITAVGSIPTCPNGSSGSANVQVGGSNNGYTYLWQNSSAVTVGTNSVATNLAPGIYSITVTGVSCGQVTRTVQVGVAPPTFYTLTKSYCGNLAILSQPGGTNYQWYNGLVPVAAPIGTANSYTITNPINGSFVTLVYTTAQGCKDSIRYNLAATPPGALSIMNIAPICTSATNGTANVIITPANNAPVGQNTYSVSGPASYFAGAGPLTSNTFVPTGLAAGIYTVNAFDGSCFYNSTFTVTPYVFNYTVSPLTTTICQGGTTNASITLGNAISGAPCTNNTGPACPNPVISTIGATNGQNGTTTWPAPYGNWYKNARHQMLFRAAELTAMGIQQGYLTSMAFNIITINGNANYPGYTIRMKCTPLTQLNTAAFDNAGLFQVFTTANHVATAGWNTHTFQTPYYWDGVSNLMVDICYNMTANYTQNCISPFTTTPFASCVVWYSDSQPACLTTQAPFTWAGSSNRPVTRFGTCSGTNPSQFTYLWTQGPGISAPTTTLTNITPLPISSTSAAIVYSIQVTPTFVNCPLVKTLTVTVINPLTPTFTPLAAQCNTNAAVTLSVNPVGGTWSGNTAITAGGVFSPSLAANGTSTVLYSVGVGSCTATGTTAVNVSQFNPATITGTVASLCVTSPNVNLMSLVQSTVNGVWSGQGVNANIFNPSTLVTNSYVLTYNTTSNPNPTVCPSSQSLTVSVTATLIPALTPIAAQCNTNVAITLTANPSGGTWSNNAGVTPSGVLTPSLAPNGASTVNYVVNIGPCVVSNSMSINVSQFNSAALTASLNQLCHTNPAINLMSLVQSTNTGVWSGTNVTGSNFTPFSLATGVYNLSYNTVSTPNPLVCPHSTVIAISVLNPPIPTLNQVGPFCNTGTPVQILASPTNGIWSTSAFLSNTGVFNPANAAIGNNVINYTTGTSTCNVTASSTISIESFVPATLVGSISDKCNTGTSENLLTYAQNQGGIWTGNGVTGSTFNPALSGTGQIVLTYNTASSPSYLCPDSRTIAVNVYSLATPAITQVNRMCNTADPQQLMVNPIGGMFFGANNNGITPEGVFNPAFGIIGANIINYSISAGPCIATGILTIDVEKFISADLTGYLGPYCNNNPPVNLNSIAQNPGGTWSGTGVGGGIFMPNMANIGNNNMVTYSTHSMPTPSLCPDTRSISIQVNGIPFIAINSNLTKGCSPTEITFMYPNGAPGGVGTWNLGDGTILNGVNVSHTFNTPGIYNVSFSYQDEIGCSNSGALANKIQIFETPRANFDFSPNEDEITIMNPEVNFNNLSTVLGNNTYNWTMASLFNSTVVNPTVVFPEAGEYPITLTALTVNGCKDQVTKYITVKNDFGMYLPNTFTPNDDGLNDVFMPVYSSYGLDLSTFSMEIFDRWGELIFTTKDIKIGWTGAKNNSGDILKQEVYVYKVRFRDAEKKVYTRTGHVNLIK